MNKKIKIITILGVVLFVSLVAFSFYYRYTTEQKIIRNLNLRAEEFINKWGNYTNSSSTEYLNLLAPYLSKGQYSATEKEAGTIREYINSGYEPNTSKVIVRDCSTTKRPEGYESHCNIEQEIVSYKKTNLKMYIFWKRIDQEYLIENWYTE
jgi:hypothetical protein